MARNKKLTEKPTKEQRLKKSLRNYGKYSSIALQMIVIIAACSFGGNYLDKKLDLETPWMTLLGSLIGVFGAMYSVIKKVS